MKNLSIRVFMLLSLLAMVPLLHPILTLAADDPVVPGFSDFGTGVSVSYIESGEITSNGHPIIVRLIVERLTLAEGESLPKSDAPQIIAVEEGNLAMIDDLGLEAALAAGEQLFAPAGSLPEITASQSTTLTRASLAAPEPDIIIGNASCDPATPSVSNLDGLTIRNETTRDQPFSIPGTSIEAVIPASGWVMVSIATVPEGAWEARCGDSSSDGTTFEAITLDVSNGHQSPTPATPNSTVLFDNEIEPVVADSSTFFMANLAIAADGSLGKQTYTGPTVLIAEDQPFWVKRPRRLTSTLSANESFVIPPDTSATIENAGKDATTALIVGLIPTPVETPEPSPTAEAVEEPGSRNVTKDDEETSPAADTSDLAAYLPSTSALTAAGFSEVSTTTPDEVSTSFFEPLTQQWVRDAWDREIMIIYDLPTNYGPESAAWIIISQFTGDRAAAAAFEEFQNDTGAIEGEHFELPPSNHFDPGLITGGTSDDEDYELTLSIIMASDGNIIVTVLVIVPIHEDSEEPARLLWGMIDNGLN